MVVYAEAGPKDVDGGGHYMETQAWLDTDNGHIEAITHTWTTNWVVGFTGAVGLVLLGANGRPLGRHSDVQWPLGVDARGIPWKPSSRTDPWAYDIDPQIAKDVGQMLIIHTRKGKDRLNDILSDITQYGRSISDFCDDNPDICSEIGGLF